ALRSGRRDRRDEGPADGLESDVAHDRRTACYPAFAPARPTSNVSCSARTASSAYLSSITHETAISEVEIIWMLMPSRAIVPNMREATPEWLRMPTPTIETFAMRSSCTTPWAPTFAATDCSAATARW